MHRHDFMREVVFTVGQHVEMRDSDFERWCKGYVISIDPVKVGFSLTDEGYEWKHVRTPMPSQVF